MAVSRRRLLHAFVIGLLGAQALTAQAAPSAAVEYTVEGRVRRPLGERGDSTGMGPTSDVWVTLHRLAKDSAGPVDSVRSDVRGHYALRFRPFGAPDAIYFASVTYGGIAYFTPPFKSATVRGDDAELTVFDTTSRTFPLSVKGRHLIVGTRDTGSVRTIIEVYELANDSLVTLVAQGTTVPTWSARIPESATNVRVNEGEVSAQAFSASNGRVQVFAPISPGVKQLSFTYTVPERSFPLAFTAEAGAVVFEILLEDMAASVQAGGFTRVGEVTIEGRTFQRFLSQDVKPGMRLAINVPPSRGPSGATLYRYAVFVALGLVVLLLVFRTMQRRARKHTGTTVPSLRPVEPDIPFVDRVRQEMAALDTLYAKQQAPTDAVTKAYHERRAELQAALKDALAGGPSGM